MSDEAENQERRPEDGKAGGANGRSATVPTTGPDAAAVVIAQKLVETKAKAVQKALGEMSSAADELRQAALFEEPEFEEAFLMLPAEVEKRYTAEYSKHIEYRRNTAAYLIGIGAPKEHICKLLGMNSRLVAELVAKLGGAVAGMTNEFSDKLLKGAGELFAVALAKKHDASTLQAAMAGGIMVDKAVAIRMLSDQGGPVVDIESENQQQRALDEKIRQAQLRIAEKQMKPAQVEQKVTEAGEPPVATEETRQD